MTKPYMLTASGKHFDLLDPKPEQVDHHDIFAAISKLCRFTGHCIETYTVGQHSLLVMSLVPPEFRLEALMHDAAEAYTGDVGTPMKVALEDLGCTAFREIEHRIEAVVRGKYGLPAKLSPEVKHADLVALGLEKRWLMPEDYGAWPVLEGVELPPDADFVDPDLGGLWPLRMGERHHAWEDVGQTLQNWFHSLTEGQFK
jgi:hypothetical protein